MIFVIHLLFFLSFSLFIQFRFFFVIYPITYLYTEYKLVDNSQSVH
jgi:hypothetical protein